MTQTESGRPNSCYDKNIVKAELIFLQHHIKSTLSPQCRYCYTKQ